MTISPQNEQPAEISPRILLVDDDPFILEMLKVSMQAFGFPFDTAIDGQVAMEKLKEHEFTVTITDMTMPRCDGMQLLKHIKEVYPKMDVIVITGHTDAYTYTEVVRAGASDFLSKPFNVDELEAKVSRVIREQKLIRKLEHLSMCDVLTDLFNRRSFDLKLQEEVPRADRQGYPIFLALIDVDNFKKYNDQYGHPAGDKLLQDIGKILRECTRENVDWCFRFGGDEFALIIPYASREQVEQIAERIIEHYRKQSRYAPTTLSIGLAQFGRHPQRSWPEDISEFVSQADQALYRCKRKGGNQVISHSQPPKTE